MNRLGNWYKEAILGWFEGKEFKKVIKGYLVAYVAAVLTLGPILTYFPEDYWIVIVWAVLYVGINFYIVRKELFR